MTAAKFEQRNTRLIVLRLAHNPKAEAMLIMGIIDIDTELQQAEQDRKSD